MCRLTKVYAMDHGHRASMKDLAKAYCFIRIIANSNPQLTQTSHTKSEWMALQPSQTCYPGYLS